MNRFFLFFSLLLFNQLCFAQRNPVSGVIIDIDTRFPLEGASVVAFPSAGSMVTDETGKFHFKSSSAIHLIQVSAIGYETKTVSMDELKKDSNRIYISNKTILLSEVTVSANPGDQYKPISKLDIKMRGINNSQEVMRLVPGLFIGQHAGGGKAEQIFLRGFDLDHGTDISISVDGMPVNMVSHAHGQGYADLHFVIPELIEHVNFKKGTYYADKGNFNTSGLVDFRTFNTLSSNSIKLEGGMFNTFRGVGMVNILGKKAAERQQSAFIASEYMYTKGFFDAPQNFNRANLFGKYYGKLSENHTLSFSASVFGSKWNASGQIPERAVRSGMIGFFGSIDPNEGGRTNRSNANLQLISTLPNGNVLKNQLYYSNYDFELYSNFTFFKEDPVNGDQIRQKEKRHLSGYNGSYSMITNAGSTMVTSEIGSNIRLDFTRNSELSRTKDRSITTNRLKLGDITELNAAAYLNETFKFSERFTINAGLRFDHFMANYKDKLDSNRIGKASAEILSPKLNFYYQHNSKMQFYITSGKGFHSNDTRVVVPQKGIEILPAAYGADIGTVLKPSKNLLLNAALWYLWLKQEFVYVGDEGIVEPSGKTRRWGFDASARYQPINFLYLDIDFNYSRGRAVEGLKGQNLLPLAPVLTSIGGITFKSKAGVNASLRYRYMADRPANEDYSVVAKGYFITDAFVNYSKHKYEVGLAIQNLFNVRWKETQFDTESRLKNEPLPVSEIHFTPGTPFFLKLSIAYSF